MLYRPPPSSEPPLQSALPKKEGPIKAKVCRQRKKPIFPLFSCFYESADRSWDARGDVEVGPTKEVIHGGYKEMSSIFADQ
jgi:hypothetical protein